MSETYLFFMDESFDYFPGKRKQNIKSCSLTGILVPVHLCIEIQDEIYALLCKHVLKEKESPQLLIYKKIGDNILHGNQFMEGYPFDKQLEMLTDIVKIINKYKIKIFRICHLVNDNNRNYFYSDFIKRSLGYKTNLIQICYGDLKSLLQEILKNNIIIPIIEDEKDNENQKLVFSKSAQHTQAMLRDSALLPKCLPQSHRNLFEIFYSKKNYSLFTGIVDCISHKLLQKQKMKESSVSINNTVRSFIDIINKISNDLLFEKIIAMQWLGNRKNTATITDNSNVAK